MVCLECGATRHDDDVEPAEGVLLQAKAFPCDPLELVSVAGFADMFLEIANPRRGYRLPLLRANKVHWPFADFTDRSKTRLKSADLVRRRVRGKP